MDKINIIETKNKRSRILDGEIIYQNGNKEKIEYSISEIAEQAYMANDDIIGVVLPDSVTKICDSAFFHCTNLANVTIPDSVTDIGFSAFSHCAALKKITLPSCINKISSFAFSCTPLEEITIPEGVEGIDAYAFFHCSELKKIVIPASVKSIDSSAFTNCALLKNVYYKGSEKDWQSINLYSYNSAPSSIFPFSEIHYNGMEESAAAEEKNKVQSPKIGLLQTIKSFLQKK